MTAIDNEETLELEFNEEDIAYLIVDAEDNEIGIAIYDDEGNTVEYYYADGEEGTGILEDAEIVFEDDEESDDDAEAFELEVSEDDIAYFIVDEDGNEIGFAITEEDGTETEYYFEGIEPESFEDGVFEFEVDEDEEMVLDELPAEAMETVAQVQAARAVHDGPFAKRAGNEVGKLAVLAGNQAGKAVDTAKSTFNKVKTDLTTSKDPDDEDLGFGIKASSVKKAAGDFTAMAKEGAQTAAELREVYDDIAEGLDFLRPRGRRK